MMAWNNTSSHRDKHGEQEPLVGGHGVKQTSPGAKSVAGFWRDAVRVQCSRAGLRCSGFSTNLWCRRCVLGVPEGFAAPRIL